MDRFTVAPPFQQPHSTTSPSVDGGVSSRRMAITRCARHEVPEVMR